MDGTTARNRDVPLPLHLRLHLQLPSDHTSGQFYPEDPSVEAAHAITLGVSTTDTARDGKIARTSATNAATA